MDIVLQSSYLNIVNIWKISYKNNIIKMSGKPEDNLDDIYSDLSDN